MTDEQHWNKYLSISDQLQHAELRFAKAVINENENRGNGPNHIRDYADLWIECLISKAEMIRLQAEYDQISEYLESIGFCP